MKRSMVAAWFAGPLMALALVACGGNDDAENPYAAMTDGVGAVERLLLQSAESDAAPGHVVQLTRVIIPAGQEIAAHTHPGTQLAVILDGTLTFTIIEGEAHVTRNSFGSGASTSTYSAGATITLNPGDAITEPEGMVHQARNQGDRAVIIFLSSLFQEGEPPATLVD